METRNLIPTYGTWAESKHTPLLLCKTMNCSTQLAKETKQNKTKKQQIHRTLYTYKWYEIFTPSKTMIMTFCNMTPIFSQVITSVVEKPAQAFSFSELKMSCRQTAHCCMLLMVNKDASMHPCVDEVEHSNIFTDIAKYSLRTDYLQRNHLTLQQHSAIMFKIRQSMKKESLQHSWTAWSRISGTMILKTTRTIT